MTPSATVASFHGRAAAFLLAGLLHGLIAYAWLPGWPPTYRCKCAGKLLLFNVTDVDPLPALVLENRAVRTSRTIPPLLISAEGFERGLSAQARQRLLGGRSAVSFIVDADGLVRTCTVLPSSTDVVADRGICRRVRGYLRYQPARGADGSAVADRVDWWPSVDGPLALQGRQATAKRPALAI